MLWAMNQEQSGLQDKRGLRFAFQADAEIVSQSTAGSVRGRVTEMSFRGCFVETSAALEKQQRVHVKIVRQDERFEALAQVMYVRPGGVGLLFGEVEPQFRRVLQKWILSSMDSHAKPKEL